jgi:lipoyl(octanoyl) transferase
VNALSGLEIDWLGCVPYAEAHELQEKAVEARRSGAAGDRLLLLEHPPVITLGRSAKAENVLATPEELAARGIETFEVRRGGDVTYHAPGQLVGYLVSDLAERAMRRGREPDVHRFLRSIESALIDALDELGLSAQTLSRMTGVFAARPKSNSGCRRKIASIGVGLRGWVSYHGFALNVDLDLSAFDSIVPCGLDFVEMTSIARELAASAPAELGELARAAVIEACTAQWGR